jgi:hypothetical protein
MVPFWSFFIGSILLTPGFLYVALLSTGAGHGDYFWAKVFFPYTMLSTSIFQSITPVFMGLAIVQVPLYGLILGVYAKAQRFHLAITSLLVVHASAVAACFVLPLENFS